MAPSKPAAYQKHQYFQGSFRIPSMYRQMLPWQSPIIAHTRRRIPAINDATSHGSWTKKRVRHCGFSVNKCLSTWQVFTRLYTANSVRLTRLNQDAKRPPIEGCLLLADWHNLHPSCPEARLPYWPSSHTIVFWSFRISLLSDYSVSPKTVSFVTMSLPSSQWIKTESPARRRLSAIIGCFHYSQCPEFFSPVCHQHDLLHRLVDRWLNREILTWRKKAGLSSALPISATD